MTRECRPHVIDSPRPALPCGDGSGHVGMCLFGVNGKPVFFRKFAHLLNGAQRSQLDMLTSTRSCGRSRPGQGHDQA